LDPTKIEISRTCKTYDYFGCFDGNLSTFLQSSPNCLILLVNNGLKVKLAPCRASYETCQHIFPDEISSSLSRLKFVCNHYYRGNWRFGGTAMVVGIFFFKHRKTNIKTF